MFDYNFRSHFGDASFQDDSMDDLFILFSVVQMKPNQRSEQGQKHINLLKEQAEDIEYEEVHC